MLDKSSFTFKALIEKELANFPSIRMGFEMAYFNWLNEYGNFFLTSNAFLRINIPINGLVWMGDIPTMRLRMKEKLAEGFTTVKMKIGSLDWNSEKELLTELRNQFAPDELTIRVDANGAFEIEKIEEILHHLKLLNVHSIEQPLAKGSIEETARLQDLGIVDIAIDEELIGIECEEEMFSLLEKIKVTYIVLKPSIHGGFKGTKKWISCAEKLGMGWWIIGLDEAPYAKEVAAHLGTDHTEIACTEKEAIALITDLPFHYDEPFADSSAIPTTLVSLAARKHVTVALSADAGDEVFAGYNRYDFLLRYGKKMNAIPGFLRKAAAGTMELIPSNYLPVLKNKYNFHNRYEKLKGVLKDPSPSNIMLSLSQQFTDQQMSRLMKDRHDFLQTLYVSDKLKADYYSPLAYMMAIDYETYLVDDILQKVDRATMTASLEGREPYLDHRVIEWAASLPDDFKYRNGEKKFILKEVVHRYIPKSMMDRPKMGFAIPLAHWLKNDLKDLVFSFINESNIDSQGIFNWNEIQKIRDDFYRGKTEYDAKLWYILMFQMWYDRWMK